MTHFQALLAPPGELSGGAGACCEPGLECGRDAMLRRSLAPLSGAISQALAAGDTAGALELAFGAASDVCDAFAASSGPWEAEQGRVHALVLELEDVPWASEADGTLSEGGTAVRISYRNWTVDGGTAAQVAASLAAIDVPSTSTTGPSEGWPVTWPRAWVVS